ncbi:MAG TPA: hypothetical protein V6D34_17630, partial [Candidatus Sericytochromatia bacterium]
MVNSTIEPKWRLPRGFMSYDDRNERYKGGYLLQSLGWMLAGGIAVTALSVGLGGWRLGDRLLASVHNLFNRAQPAPKVDVQSVVIQQVRGVSELTTAV